MPSVAELLGSVECGKWGATSEPPFKVVRLGDRGPVLPIGKAVGSEVRRDFRFARPDGELAIRLADIKRAPLYKRHPGRRVAACLGESLEVLCGENLRAPGVTEAARENAVRALPWFDVVHLVMWRAMEREVFALEPPAPPDMVCPRCKKEIRRLRVDWNDARIPVWEWTTQNPPRVVAAPSEPIRFGSMSASRVVMGPANWDRATGTLTEAEIENEVRADLTVAAAAIVAGEDGVEPGPWGATPVDSIARLRERDLNLLTAASGVVGGDPYPLLPKLVVRCPACDEAQKRGEIDESEIGRVGLSVRWRDFGFC